MAKKKPVDPAKPGRVSVVHLQGSVDEYNWLEDAHKKTHIAKATIVRLALTDWGKTKGLRAYPSED